MEWEWVCMEPDCDFRTGDKKAASEHQKRTGHLLVHNWDRDHAGIGGWWYLGPEPPASDSDKESENGTN